MSTYYSEEHEWVTVDGDTVTIGITEHAAEQLGDVVYVELKEVGEKFMKGGDIGVIESVKAASEIYAPVSGEIVAANEIIAEEPSKVNESPESDAWIYKIKMDDTEELSSLMDADAYNAFIR